MNEHEPQNSTDVYLAPKLMGAIAAMELGGLAIANVLTDVSDAYNDTMLTTAGSTLAGAALGTIAGYVLSRNK